MVKTQFFKQVKVVKTNNDNEFKSGPMKSFYREKGVTHQTICLNIPKQNGRIERKHRHLPHISRELQFQANPPLSFRVNVCLQKHI